MERIWLKSYPEGVPADVNVNEFSSIKDILKKSCEKYADRPAFTSMGVSISYRELDRLTQEFAGFLQSKIGAGKQARVAIMMPNLLQYPVAVFGVLRAGYTVVNVNPLYTPRELEHQLNDSGADVIVILENFCSTLQEVVGHTKVRHVVTTQIGDMFSFPKSFITNLVVKRVKKMVPAWNIANTISFKQALSIGRGAQYSAPNIGREDIAFLQYTGGTTGVPKGAMLTHGNIVANLQQVSSWMGNSLSSGVEVVLSPLPLYHIFALTSSLVFMKEGGNSVLIANPRDIPGLVKVMQETPWTVMTGVNTLFNALLQNEEFRKLDFSRIKLAMGGGMAVQRAVAERWQQVTGKALVEAYGLTETSPGACINPLTIKEFNGMIGLPIPSTIITIRDDDENILPVGGTGEICIAGPQVMKGYWNKPEETAKVMARDGAFKTGDIGVMDEAGFVKIVDRKKDMILVSGFNVYPNEIEDVVVMHPGVLECCAVAAKDEKSGEVVRLVIVKKDANLTKEAIMDHCRKHLTGYKVPKIVEFWKELPKTNVGKILRKDVRDRKASAEPA